MDDEELEPRTLRPKPTDMDVMSVEALHEYIAELEAEIQLARDAIRAKETWRDKADGFFKV